MSMASGPESGSGSGARDSRRVGWLLTLPLPVALLAFGAVHPGPRLLLALLCAAVGAHALWTVPRDRAGTPAVILTLAPAVLALGLGLISLVPLSHAGRAAWQPGFAPALDAVLALAGQREHSLALAPSRVLSSIGFAASLLLFSMGVALSARSRRRQLRLAVGVVASGVALVLLGLAQRAGGAQAIYWLSSVEGGAREPFFGSLVNPNHAGILLAAALPLAGSLALRPRKEWRALGVGAALLLAVGLVATGSRGALVEGLVAAAVFAAVLGGARVAPAPGGPGAVGPGRGPGPGLAAHGHQPQRAPAARLGAPRRLRVPAGAVGGRPAGLAGGALVGGGPGWLWRRPHGDEAQPGIRAARTRAPGAAAGPGGEWCADRAALGGRAGRAGAAGPEAGRHPAPGPPPQPAGGLAGGCGRPGVGCHVGFPPAHRRPGHPARAGDGGAGGLGWPRGGARAPTPPAQRAQVRGLGLLLVLLAALAPGAGC